MADHLRVALAANLSRAADTLDALASRASGPEPANRAEQLEEAQAAIDAGAAVWEGVLRGLLNVPAIARLVGELAGQGSMRPDTVKYGHDCANLFHDVMRIFLYPEGEGVFPYFAFRKETQQAHQAGNDGAGELSVLWRRHELQEAATGCRMLASLIESGLDEQFRSKKELKELFGSLAEELGAYADYVRQEGQTGREHELRIFEYVYQVRCYYSGSLPDELGSLWEKFLDATTPYEAIPEAAAESADGMLTWIRGNAGRVLNRPSSTTVDNVDTGREPARPESVEVPVIPPQFSPNRKGGIMARESPFPYEYGSDLHWLWGWGERLGSLLSDDVPPSKHDWMMFRPDRLARDAMMRFSIKYPHIIKQIDDYLDFTDARFDAFLRDDNDSTLANVVSAMDSLCRRITVGVETIAQAERAAGQPEPTAGPQSSSRPDEPSNSEDIDRDRSDRVPGELSQRVRGEVFISYSHKDRQWLDDLQTYLKPCLRKGSMTAWSDQQIATGSEWFPEIQDALARTSAAVLLVTPNFLASDFIHEHELTPILKEADRDGVRIVWIPVRACAFTKTPLEKYQAVIPPEKPLATMKRPQRDEAWVKICQEIEKAAKQK